MKICHLTSVHPRNDIRIYRKEILSLRKADHHVILIVADSKGDDEKNFILDVGKEKSRILRILRTSKKLYNKAIAENADVYHLHDPELLPIALKLKRNNKIVIFDFHEDIPKQLISKPYLNRYLLKWISRVFAYYEKRVCAQLDYIITATPSIRTKFKKINEHSIAINNYPLLEEMSVNKKVAWEKKENRICYIGRITLIRGVREIMKALFYTSDVILDLAGNFDNKKLEYDTMKDISWSKVNYFGFVDRKKTLSILGNAKAGIVLYLPYPNHLDAQPNKIFEYMASGIPVIASDFPLWKKIIEENNCGICVDPKNTGQLTNAINYILHNNEEAKLMGENGRKAVMRKYNWSSEEQKLLSVYHEAGSRT
ncbi:MAG: glycosyltransferase family 4 protein [Bacteroidales bacterium]